MLLCANLLCVPHVSLAGAAGSRDSGSPYQHGASLQREVTLFSGGFTDTQGNVAWAARFGAFAGDPTTIHVSDGVAVDDQPDKAHAEAQDAGVVGAHFTYAASIAVPSSVDAHVQFRIGDAGRYGIRLRTDGIVFYRFLREDKPYSANPAVVAHCPDWRPHPARKAATTRSTVSFKAHLSP